MKIIVIGAGNGGLQSAKVLAKNGHEVIVYEQGKRGFISYDWRDDVEYTVFDDLNIAVPEGSHRIQNVSFMPPFSDKPLFIYQEESKMEWGVERRVFSEQLATLAMDEGATIYYETTVDSLIVEGDKVKGVQVNGEKIYADLVIDCSGVNSPFRATVPDSFGIEKSPNSNEVFHVYRAMYNKVEGVEEPTKHRRVVYLRPMGLLGIAWCVIEPDNTINVLVGKIGGLTEEEKEEMLAYVKARHPIAGDDIVYGGRFATIPVRYPLTRMIADGYVAIGDSAFMTIPMIGSGIACGLRAGQILGEEISKANSCDINVLWNYQVRYYQEVGNKHFLIDSLKRAVLVGNPKDIGYVIDAGFITEDDIKGMTGGQGKKMGFKDICKKIPVALKRLPFIIFFVKSVLKGVKASKLAKKIPTEYDVKKIAKWEKKLKKYFA